MLSLTNHQSVEAGSSSATPTFAGALANGALIVDDHLVFSQGASDGEYHIGNPSSSHDMYNSTQDLYLSLDGINLVSQDDLTGITLSDPIEFLQNPLTSTYSSADIDQRINLTLLAYQAYTNSMIKPSDLALLSVANKDSDLTPDQLVDRILDDYTTQVEDFFGSSLDDMSSNDITEKVFNTLYDRNPDSDELSEWSFAVDNGLSKRDLPMAILRYTFGQDTYRIALLSAASKWSQTQWGNNAVVDGDFGQGLLSEVSAFNHLSDLILDSGSLNDWESANAIFSQYRDDVVASLSGSPISDTGFF